MPENYNPDIEEIKRMMANAGGTNLAGQSMAGPVATGQQYAQSIAGGMPMSQVIAPGVSYSPEQAGGYTQADLDLIAQGPAPVMPIPPTTGEVATIDDQMSFAPPGVTQPTPYIPGQSPFPGMGNFDFLQNIDFSNLTNIDELIGEKKGGLFGGIGQGITGLQGMQQDFKGFKEDMKDKAANKVLGLFGI